jgi:hypothetical protein
MTKKNNRSETPSEHPSRKTASEANPAAAARRRLLRAVAGSGAAMLGGQFTSGWQKPVVNAVILPAHAQLSAVTPVNCPVTMVATVSQATSYPYSASVFLSGTGGGTTLLSEADVPGGYGTLISGIATLPAGSYSAFFRYSGPNVPWAFTLDVSCCDGFARFQSEFMLQNDPYDFTFGRELGVVGDGSCTVV